MVDCFCEKLGNAFVIGMGSHEIAKFWFNTKDHAKSPLSEEEAKQIATGMCDFFNTKYDMSKFTEEMVGSSEKQKAKIQFIDGMMNECE